MRFIARILRLQSGLCAVWGIRRAQARWAAEESGGVFAAAGGRLFGRGPIVLGRPTAPAQSVTRTRDVLNHAETYGESRRDYGLMVTGVPSGKLG